MNFPGRTFQNFGGALRVAALFWLGLGLFWFVARQSPAQSQSRAEPVFPVLTNIAQVLALSEDALRNGRQEVRIHGVITYIPPGRSRLYVQDGTNAIYADFTNAISNCAPGDVVEVAGPVKRGYLVPRIVPTELRVLGQAPLPEPKRGDVARLAAGEDAMKFVVVRGTVRDMMMVAGPYLMLLVSDHGATYRVHTPMPDGALVPREWLDAEIEARGMSRPISDNYGNAFGFVLYQNSTNFISILRPGSSNLFDRPLRTIREAMQAPADTGRRIKIAGVVLAHVPAKTLFLQDTTGVIRARLLAPLPKSTDEVQYLEHEPQTQLQPGERVEVIGSRFDGSSLTPGLSDAEFRRVGRATAAAPQAVSIVDLEGGKFADRLVTLKARLLDQRASSVSNTGHLWLVLEADGHVFQALWESESPAQWNLQPDSYYQVTGVNDVQSGDLKKGRAFHLVLRSPADAVVTDPPPFWTRPEARRVAGIGLIIACLAAGWTAFERRQIRRMRASDEAVKRSEAVTRTINYFATSLLERDTEDDVLWDLARNCISQIGFLDCVIYLFDANRSVLVQKAALGPKSPGGRIILNPITIPVGRGIVGSVAASGKPELISDTRLDQRYIVDDKQRLSELAVPIIANNAVIGVIDSEHPQKDFFTAEHLQMLTSVASLCANKLVRLQAEQKLLAMNIELERRVDTRTSELLAANEQLTRTENDVRVALAAERELNQLKSSFVSMVSHEFRTPLEVILSSSNILDRYLERLPPEKRAAQLRAIRKSVHRMNDLIDDVLLLGKFDAGVLNCQPVPLDLARFCRRAAREIESAAARDGAIVFNAADEITDACADEGLLQHILTNILGNAVKYSSPGRPVEFTLSRHGSEARFVVRDYGCGIPAADQTRLFTAFYRGSNVGKTSGSGLGLVIAKRCVDLHGGIITCDSTEGSGTTFTITLPLFDGTRLFHRRTSGKPQIVETSL